MMGKKDYHRREKVYEMSYKLLLLRKYLLEAVPLCDVYANIPRAVTV